MAPPSPVLIGVVGDSGSGKTTLSSCIAQAVGTERATLICLDDYHRYDRTERERRGITALDPECNRLDLVAEHLAALRAGSAITKPVYDHHDGTFGPDEVVAPREIIVVRGLLGLHTEALTRCFDLSVFLDPDPDLRVRWKVERDCAKRGYSRGEVLEQIAQRRPDADRFIAPQRHRADLVIRFAPGTNRAGGAGDPHLDMQITVRRAEQPTGAQAVPQTIQSSAPGVTATGSPTAARTLAGQRIVPMVLSAAEWARDIHAAPRSPVSPRPPDQYPVTS